MIKRICSVLLFMSSFALAQNELPSGQQLLEKVLDIMNPENSRGILEQIIQTSRGDERTFTYESFSTNYGEKSILRYLSPSRVKGNAILMTDYSDNIWFYFRRTNRIRKLASHAKKQKFEGSDFTYEDMGAGNSWKKDYQPRNNGLKKIDHQDCYELLLKAKNKDVSYSRIVCCVRIKDLFPVRIDYYDQDGNFLKSLLMEDIRIVEGIPTAMEMTMKNHLDNTQTILKIKEITYNVHFPGDFFTEKNLKR